MSHICLSVTTPRVRRVLPLSVTGLAFHDEALCAMLKASKIGLVPLDPSAFQATSGSV